MCVCMEGCHLFVFLPCSFLPLSSYLDHSRLLSCHVLQSSHLPSCFSLSVPSCLISTLNSTSLGSSLTLSVFIALYWTQNPHQTVGPSLFIRIQTEKSRNTVKVLVRNLEVTGTSLCFGNICRLFVVLLVSYLMPVLVLMSSGVCDRAWKTVSLLPDM